PEGVFSAPFGSDGDPGGDLACGRAGRRRRRRRARVRGSSWRGDERRAAWIKSARRAAREAGVPETVPSETVNRVCGSGLQAVVHAAEAINTGYVDLVVAGGTESMSNAPYLLKGARWGYRMGNA